MKQMSKHYESEFKKKIVLLHLKEMENVIGLQDSMFRMILVYR